MAPLICICKLSSAPNRMSSRALFVWTLPFAAGRGTRYGASRASPHSLRHRGHSRSNFGLAAAPALDPVLLCRACHLQKGTGSELAAPPSAAPTA